MRWLVFGLSGPVGQAMLARPQPGEAELLAVSRQAQATRPGLSWLEARLEAMPEPPGDFDAVVSLGPLDAFARWFEAHGPDAPRVVALGSTSVHSKADSPDPVERRLALDLAESEQRLADACAASGSAMTLLRPTLIYGNGRDRSLSRAVAVARRWRCLPLPSTARGLRQPVHADDLAGAVLQALRAPAPVPGRFDLPGGETVAFDEMLRRCLQVAAPGARVLALPAPLFRAGLALLRISARPGAAEAGMLARMDRDQVFDAGPARTALGYQPRGFQPDAGMFEGLAATQQ